MKLQPVNLNTDKINFGDKVIAAPNRTKINNHLKWMVRKVGETQHHQFDFAVLENVQLLHVTSATVLKGQSVQGENYATHIESQLGCGMVAVGTLAQAPQDFDSSMVEAHYPLGGHGFVNEKCWEGERVAFRRLYLYTDPNSKRKFAVSMN